MARNLIYGSLAGIIAFGGNVIPSKESNPTGFHARYIVSRADGTAVNPNAEYFILRLDDLSSNKEHILASRLGVLAYADAIANTNPQMAKDLYAQYNKDLDGAMLKPEPHF